jgi:hypothetical protein
MIGTKPKKQAEFFETFCQEHETTVLKQIQPCNLSAYDRELSGGL